MWDVAGIAGVMALALTLGACGLSKKPDKPGPATLFTANALVNSGFEQGTTGWQANDRPGWAPFSVGSATARTGQNSVELHLSSGGGTGETRIAGAVQTIQPQTFPEFVSGFYRVDRWQPNAGFQYLQFVVIVRGGDFGDDAPVHQIRVLIAGAASEPFLVTNSKYVFLSRDAPKTGQWTYFGYPIKQAFASKLGRVPTRWDSIDVYFEARYDAKSARDGEAGADVSYDDLYVGPQAASPNRPREP